MNPPNPSTLTVDAHSFAKSWMNLISINNFPATYYPTPYKSSTNSKYMIIQSVSQDRNNELIYYFAHYFYRNSAGSKLQAIVLPYNNSATSITMKNETTENYKTYFTIGYYYIPS